MGWLQTLAAELAITVSNGDVWFSVGQAFLFGGACLWLGTWVARKVGLLDAGAPAGETLGVGLASGLVVLTAFWAALASGGRSSFTPVAVGFAVAIALALARTSRTSAGEQATAPTEIVPELTASRTSPRKSLILAVALSGAFVTTVALLYGSTMALSPRDGVQPIEFMDEAFYSILGADLADTGTETIYLPSGFPGLEGRPPQAWYHWGELWLASVVIRIFGTEPLLARHIIVLPMLLLAAAALTGTLVRRMAGAGTTSRRAFLFGMLACMFLAPVSLIPGPFFSSWAVGLIYGITLYGLAAVAVLLAIYSIGVLPRRRATWSLACFVGSVVATIVPAHLVIALLAAIGAGSVWTIRILLALIATRRLPIVSPIWRCSLIWTGVAIVSTVTWGLLTGHGVGGSGSSPSVSPFNATWRESVAIIIIGAGAFLAIAGAWVLVRRDAPVQADMYVGTTVLLIAGAVAWGARLGDFNMFHVFFGGIAVFATPVAAIAVWSVWIRLRASGRPILTLATVVLCLAQIEFGAALGVVRLQRFGPGNYEPVPLELLAAIRRLPVDAKLAYSCQPFEELAIWDARLLGISAHTARRIVPMCFQSDPLGALVGGDPSLDVMSPLFQAAPQRVLYPDPSANPSADSIVAFLKAHGIDYIYADGAHPNALVPEATEVAAVGRFQLLQVP